MYPLSRPILSVVACSHIAARAHNLHCCSSELPNRYFQELLAGLPKPLKKYTTIAQPDQKLSAPEPGTCPWQEYECPTDDVYRTMDGSCNNLANPLWGRKETPLRRELPAKYNDGMCVSIMYYFNLSPLGNVNPFVSVRITR